MTVRKRIVASRYVFLASIHHKNNPKEQRAHQSLNAHKWHIVVKHKAYVLVVEIIAECTYIEKVGTDESSHLNKEYDRHQHDDRAL